MSGCVAARCDELDSLVRDELASAATADLRAHAQSCAACARELQWLRAERTALKARPGPSSARVVAMRGDEAPPGLRAVRERARQLQSRDRAVRRSLIFAAVGAAAALLVAVQGAPHAAVASIPADADEGAELSSSAFPWCGERPDAVRTVESAFSACLTATPRALPGWPAVCL